MSNTPAIFITIPLSHYCEKARWGLDRAKLPYREEAHVPLLSRLATRRGDGGTVPVFVQGAVRLTDSSDILAHADATRGGELLYPKDPQLRSQVEDFVKRFDKDLGTHVRRWAYVHLLPEKALLRDLWSRGAPPRETAWLPLIVPVARRLLRSAYKVTPVSGARSLERVQEVFDEVDARLWGRRFLVGDRFTAADLTFAALAAPVLFPAECGAVLPALDDVPAAMRADVLRLRETRAGKFALRLYHEERANRIQTDSLNSAS